MNTKTQAFQGEPCDHSSLKRVAIVGAHVVEQGDISGGGGIVIPISDALVPPHGSYESSNPESHDFALMVLNEPVTYSDKGGITCSFFINVGSASFCPRPTHEARGCTQKL